MSRSFGQRLRRAFDRPEGDTSDLVGGRLRADLQRRHLRRQAKVPKVVLPPGDTIENGRGRCFLRRLTYPLDLPHGHLVLGSALEADRDRLAVLAKDEAVADLAIGECLFLDTETTGLSGGAGTVVFMVGLGFFDGGQLVLEQTFLRNYSDEPAALQHVARRLKEYPHLVTFVGKSFDRHRLAARMAVHKIRSRVLSSRHLDLYYLARRAWRDQLPDVKLQTLERHKLGIHRSDDLPGAEAPAAFLNWIRDEVGEIGRVFEHNRLDVLTTWPSR